MIQQHILISIKLFQSKITTFVYTHSLSHTHICSKKCCFKCHLKLQVLLMMFCVVHFGHFFKFHDQTCHFLSGNLFTQQSLWILGISDNTSIVFKPIYELFMGLIQCNVLKWLLCLLYYKVTFKELFPNFWMSLSCQA